MKHRTAIILLGGWLLMKPPVVVDTDHFSAHLVESAPINEWTQVIATDTARQCEEIRLQIRGKAKEEAQNCYPKTTDHVAEPKTPRERWQKIEEDDCFWQNAGFHVSRCIPSEHIYPPKKAE